MPSPGVPMSSHVPYGPTLMSTYILIHGAGSDSWYWHRVAPLLRERGHDVVTPDLGADDDSAGLAEYTDTVVDAIGDCTDLILVAQSLGGFTAPLVCDRVPVTMVVLVAAMVPLPGESPGDWWANTGHDPAIVEQATQDPETVFLHDLPAAVKAEAMHHARPQSGTPFEKTWPLDAWPDVPTRFLLCRDDRFFPPDFLRPTVQERLGIVPDEMDGGHLPALARPDDLVERLEAYRAER
jgi:pimeloyl-ACP methyl ester carboxylesterase